MNASTKITRNSAVAGIVTAVLFGLQELQQVEDLPPIVLVLVGPLVVLVTTFGAGYQTTEKNPSPSMLLAARKSIGE